MTSFSAAQWERAHGLDFITWRNSSSGPAIRRFETLCRVLEELLERSAGREAADRLPAVMESCDDLAFVETDEAYAYVALHFAPRYIRVLRVLELLMERRILPLRKGRLTVLDVGAGPAPSIYAVVDFYDDLAAWAETNMPDVTISPVTDAHPLDRGPAWDVVLHYLSELLVAVRAASVGEGFIWPFRRSYAEFEDFDVRREHILARERYARAVYDEFDLVDEPISMATARKLTAQDTVSAPSAYDLIFLMNFLTSAEMTSRFVEKFRRIARSLTPGGVLVVLGAVGDPYPQIYARVRALTRRAGLTEIELTRDPVKTKLTPSIDTALARHVRCNVARLLETHSNPELVAAKLPRTLWKDGPFSMPRFQALAFVRRT